MKLASSVFICIGLALFLGSCTLEPQAGPAATRTAPPATRTPLPTHTPTSTNTPLPTATASPVPLRYPLSQGTPLPDQSQVITRYNTQLLKVVAAWKDLDESGEEPQNLSISPDGRRLVVGMSKGHTLLVDPLTGKVEKVFENDNGGANIPFTPDGKKIATIHGWNEVKVMDVESGDEVGAFENKSIYWDYIWKLLFSPTGETIVTMRTTQGTDIWDTSTWEKITRIDTRQGSAIMDNTEMRDMAFSPDGKWLVTACFNGAVNFWNAKSWYHVATINLRTRKNGTVPERLGFSPDGKWLVITGSIGTPEERHMFYVVDMSKYQVVSEKRLSLYPQGVHFSPSGEVMAIDGLFEGSFFITDNWNNAGTIQIPQDTSKNFLFDMTFSPDGRFIYTASRDGVVRVWGWR